LVVLRCIFVVLEPEKIGEADYGSDESDEEAPTDDWDFIVAHSLHFSSSVLSCYLLSSGLISIYRFYNGEQISGFRLGPLLRTINLCVYSILILLSETLRCGVR